MMKKILLAAMCWAGLSAAAAAPTNHGQYVLVPAEASAPGLFLAEGPDGAVVVTNDYSLAAAWQWDWVSGTATVAGHYTLKNLSSNHFLYSAEPDGRVMVSNDEVAISRRAGTENQDASVFGNGATFLTTTAGEAVVASTEPTAASEFFLMTYSPTASAEEMTEAANLMRHMITARAAAIAELEPIFRASYSGTNGLRILYSNVAASTDDESLAETITEMRRVGIRMFESDMEVGATWQQLSTGLWVTFADNKYCGTATADISGLWYAEFTDNGNTVIDNRTFYLRSGASKRYLTAPQADGSITDTARRSDATLWRVVVNPGGLAIAVNDDSTDSRLLYLNSDGILSVNSGANAPAAASYAGNLPTFGQGINSVTPAGAEGEVSEIRITVARGAEPRPSGEISLVLRRDDSAGNAQTTTLCSLPASLLANPKAETISVDFYNSNGEHITGRADVDIYTLTLDSVYTAGGEYMARVSFGTFELNGALSEEMGGYLVLDETDLWQLLVQPAADSEMRILEKITINGPNGVYANTKGAEQALLTLKFIPADSGFTEDLLQAPVTDFREGGKYDSYDLGTDWFTIPCGYTDAGSYTLTVPQGFFIDNAGAPCGELSIGWTVDPDAALRAPSAPSAPRNDLYDLQGRRLPGAPRTLHIRNGRLTLPK